MKSKLSSLPILASVPASAGVIVQSNVYSGPSVHGKPFGGIFSQFDPSLGILDSVSLALFGQQTFTTTFTLIPNCTDCYIDAEYGYSVGFNFNAPGFPISIPNNSPFNFVNNAHGFLVPPDTSTRVDVRTFGGNELDASLAFLNSYVGLGTVLVAGYISEDSDICIGHGILCKQSNNLNLTTQLTYNYTAIPEPITISLFVVGLLGAATMRRRFSVKIGAKI